MTTVCDPTNIIVVRDLVMCRFQVPAGINTETIIISVNQKQRDKVNLVMQYLPARHDTKKNCGKKLHLHHPDLVKSLVKRSQDNYQNIKTNTNGGIVGIKRFSIKLPAPVELGFRNPFSSPAWMGVSAKSAFYHFDNEEDARTYWLSFFVFTELTEQPRTIYDKFEAIARETFGVRRKRRKRRVPSRRRYAVCRLALHQC